MSQSESFRVQLFSKPQAIHARNAKTEYGEKERDLLPSNDRRIPAMLTRIIPIQRRGEIFSLKIKKAITEVAAISRLLISEMFAAETYFDFNMFMIEKFFEIKCFICKFFKWDLNIGANHFCRSLRRFRCREDFCISGQGQVRNRQ